MPAPDLSSYKVAALELSSSTKFDNFVQAVQDEFSDIDADQIPGFPSSVSKYLRGDGLWAGDYAAYTPTWTASGTAPGAGNLTFTARYLQVAKSVVAYGNITFGSTSTFGTGDYSFALPVAAASAAANARVGVYDGLDSSGAVRNIGNIYLPTTTTMQLFHPATWPTGTLAIIGQLVPWTWAQNDTLAWVIQYEASL